MAQRVFLIQVPIADLSAITSAIQSAQNDLDAVADDLATRRHRHVATVAASELVGAGVNNFDLANTPPAWDFARNCLPFIVAATRADEIVREVGHVEAMKPDEVARYLRDQATKIGVRVGKARDKSSYAPPTRDQLREWIAYKLDTVATLRGQIADKTSGQRYAAGSWLALAQLFTALYPSFWQGNNRWLGAAAFPQESGATGLFARGQAMAAMLPPFMQQARGRAPKAVTFPKLPSIASAMCSVGDLEPPLMEPVPEASWRSVLAPCGNAGLATGGVAHAKLGTLIDAMRDPAVKRLPFDGTDEWIELVTAAAMLAREANAHLLEGDELYRWPLE